MALQTLVDTYTMLAGDAAAGFTGRGFNWDTHRWETLSQVNLGRSVMTRYRLRYMQLFIRNVTTLSLKQGVVVSQYVVADPHATDRLIRLPGCELQGAGSVVSWVGDYPMLAGCLYRANLGVIATGDVVECVVGYE